MRKFVARLKQPVRHPEFLGPGLVLLILSAMFLCLAFTVPGASDRFNYPVAGIVTAMLVLFRTRLGTALYFCLLFALLFEQLEHAFRFGTFRPKHTDHLFMLFLGLLMGPGQIVHHLRKHRSR